MDPMRDVAEASTSTLVLIQDAEYELHASRASIAFPKWSAVEAKGQRRTVRFSVCLLARSLPDVATDPRASVPLVITSPWTSRFTLQSRDTSLTTLLRIGSPLQFEAEFVPPLDPHDSDFGCANFQDHIIIQTRLAKLCIRLCAVRDEGSADICASESFVPRVLPSVKAPSFKLFDQIERDAAASENASPQRPPSSSHRVTISGSFHPQRNTDHRIESLAPLPPRQPTPPQQPTVISSRPSSSSSRRTPSPRVLEPLVAVPGPAVSTAVDNQADAKEIILRLRARRSSHNLRAAKSIITTDVEPTSPESHLDAKAKAELDEFNALVKAAKQNVAGEKNKAKQELEYYKSLLPGQPIPTSSSPVLPTRPAIDVAQQTQKGIPKKPARLPALPGDIESTVEMNYRRTDTIPRPEQNQNVGAVEKPTNQELSPVKRTQPKPLTTKATKPVQTPEPFTTTKAQPPKQRPRDTSKPVDGAKPQVVPKSVANASTKPIAVKTATTKASTTKGTPVDAKSSKQPTKGTKKAIQVAQLDHALDDFDDADPEIDDAPVLPDDLRTKRSLREDEEEDDPMLTMNAPLY